MQDARAQALQLIRRNIERHGFHLYLIAQHSTPRVVYTIGLSESIGAELVLAGAIDYAGEEAARIVHAIRDQLATRGAARIGEPLSVEGLGSFTLQVAHESWSRLLLLGAFDFYRPKVVTAYQIVPDASRRTIDVPDMTKPWSAEAEPAWRWLGEPWPYAIPETSTATTNLAALRGQRVTELARWEVDDWEMFAGDGSQVTEAEMRVVPISTLVGADPTLAPALDLAVGAGVWRDKEGGDWNVWASKQ